MSVDVGLSAPLSGAGPHPAAGAGSSASVDAGRPSGYAAFIASKAALAPSVGATVEPEALHPRLRDFQRDATAWAIEKGRAALWEDTGLGKTAQQLEWARHSAGPDGRALVVAPLAVCEQTIREASLLDLDVRFARDDGDITGPGVWITNYERVGRMPRGAQLDAVVLDEGSILRDSTGKTRNLLVEQFAATPRRLTCTATPAPNEAEELTNQAEFLGVMTRVDMLASYFVHEGNTWRPKGHARGPMASWMATWALALRRPSDLGYSDQGYDLPGLDLVPEVVEAHVAPAEGELFAATPGGVGGRARVRKQTAAARVERTVELVGREPDEPWALWCGLNDEAAALARAIPGAVNVHGSMSPEEKAEALLAFADGGIRVLITKPSIAGRGLNFQRCARTALCGVSDSFEDQYQVLRRFHRYGQTRRVHAHLVVSELEQQVVANVARKERDHDRTMTELVRAMRRARGLGAAA